MEVRLNYGFLGMLTKQWRDDDDQDNDYGAQWEGGTDGRRVRERERERTQ